MRPELDLRDLSKLGALPPELANLATLRSIYLNGTQVSDLSPLAGLTALQILSLNRTQVNDLTPIAGLTNLYHLIYQQTPASRQPPFDQLVLLKGPARTIETINEVRRQQGLPEHIPDGYERPQDFPDAALDLRPPEPAELPPRRSRFRRPALPRDLLWSTAASTSFLPRFGKIKRNRLQPITPAPASSRRRLAERLSKTDAVPDVAASVAALGDVLGDSVEGCSAGSAAPRVAIHRCKGPRLRTSCCAVGDKPRRSQRDLRVG